MTTPPTHDSSAASRETDLRSVVRLIVPAVALLGVEILQRRVGVVPPASWIAGVAAALGVAVAPRLFSSLQQRLRHPDLPARLRGAPSAALLAVLLAVVAAGAIGLGTSASQLDTVLLAALLLVCGTAQHWATRVRVASIDTAVLSDRIDQLLPQTQCGQCTYAGCRPYAEAIARAEADINQCPPGGDAGIRALARLLGREAKPLNPAHGVEKPKALAVIDEATCIGCTKCIQACPVDAILGASKLMHTVIADLCTGCELCLPPCPVDCIEMVASATPPTVPDADRH